MAVESVTSDNFSDKVLGHEGETVIVDVWASWCGPCLAIAPMFELLSENYDAKFVKLNADENYEAMGALNVKALPTFIAIKDGEVVGRQVGGRNLEAFIKQHV